MKNTSKKTTNMKTNDKEKTHNNRQKAETKTMMAMTMLGNQTKKTKNAKTTKSKPKETTKQQTHTPTKKKGTGKKRVTRTGQRRYTIRHRRRR